MEFPLYLSICGVLTSVKGVIYVYVMHMAGDNTQENKKGHEATKYQSDRFPKLV
jgi:hypothetical protein